MGPIRSKVGNYLNKSGGLKKTKTITISLYYTIAVTCYIKYKDW